MMQGQGCDLAFAEQGRDKVEPLKVANGQNGEAQIRVMRCRQSANKNATFNKYFVHYEEKKAAGK